MYVTEATKLQNSKQHIRFVMYACIIYVELPLADIMNSKLIQKYAISLVHRIRYHKVGYFCEFKISWLRRLRKFC